MTKSAFPHLHDTWCSLCGGRVLVTSEWDALPPLRVICDRCAALHRDARREPPPATEAAAAERDVVRALEARCAALEAERDALEIVAQWEADATAVLAAEPGAAGELLATTVRRVRDERDALRRDANALQRTADGYRMRAIALVRQLRCIRGFWRAGYQGVMQRMQDEQQAVESERDALRVLLSKWVGVYDDGDQPDYCGYCGRESEREHESWCLVDLSRKMLPSPVEATEPGALDPLAAAEHALRVLGAWNAQAGTGGVTGGAREYALAAAADVRQARGGAG